ncbi:hypothetical protein [Georgenia deserti]|uniref:Lipoprotein n=1 Tax=Georgenia deserti TaxID=2093781 RepID=A0ABW4L226_9MICO
MALSRRGVRTVVALAACGAVVAGCSAQPGTAAVVNGTRITESQVDAATRDWNTISAQPVSLSQVAHTLVQAELFEPIATDAGYGYSDQQVEQALSQAATSQQMQPPEEYSEAAIDLGRFILQQGDISQSQDAQDLLTRLQQATDQAALEMNPRYGTPDSAGQIVPTSYPWLHQEDQGEQTGQSGQSEQQPGG